VESRFFLNVFFDFQNKLKNVTKFSKISLRDPTDEAQLFCKLFSLLGLDTDGF